MYTSVVCKYYRQTAGEYCTGATSAREGRAGHAIATRARKADIVILRTGALNLKLTHYRIFSLDSQILESIDSKEPLKEIFLAMHAAS